MPNAKEMEMKMTYFLLSRTVICRRQTHIQMFKIQRLELQMGYELGERRETDKKTFTWAGEERALKDHTGMTFQFRMGD